MPEEEYDLDSPDAENVPDLGLGEIIKWAPIIEEVMTAVEGALTGGALTVPPITFRVSGRRVTLGPCPISVSR